MLNLQFYKGNDLYSDGDVENFILDIVKSGKNLDSIPEDQLSWPVFYHLSPLRANILNWYPFNKNSSLLEIGAGCGAITGMLCSKTKSVTAVELSERRSMIIDARHYKHQNLEIIVGNFNDIEFSRKFDYITLIGVLEYAPSFTNSHDPATTFLKRVKKLLKNSGKLFIAIENQFGMKYWAGANEDHLGKTFSGIEGYFESSHVRTFGKVELEQKIKNAGFKNISFYYPYPDYKFPEQIFTDDRLPSVAEIYNTTPLYDSESLALFNEKKVFAEIIKNDSYGFFANSFLVECEL